MAGISEFFLGSPAKTEQVSTMTPQQQQLISSLLQQLMTGLGSSQASFAPIRASAQEHFKQEIIPTIAERFTAMGGRQGTNAYPMALGQAGANLERDLAAQESQFNLQRQGNLMQILGLAMRPQFENVYNPSSPGFLQNVAAGAASGVGTLFAPWLYGGNELISALYGKK